MKEPNVNFAVGAVSDVTPGVILKAARQEQGLSVVDVAARLCLSVQFIEDIERDDYSHMAARVYARGHVMAYAHLLGIPETQITPALVNVNMHFEPAKNAILAESEQSIPIYQPVEASGQRSGLMVWGSILVLIILIGLVMLWWKGPSALDSKTPNSAPQGKPTEVIIQQPQSQSPTPTSNASTPSSTPVSTAPAQTTQTPQKPQDASVLQPSEFRESSGGSNQSDAAVILPPPRASANG